MGLAKYFEDLVEDNQVLQDFYFNCGRNTTSSFSLDSTLTSSQLLSKKPYLKKEIQEFLEIYVNNKKLFGKEQTYSDICTLSLKIPRTIEELEISDDMGNKYLINRNEGESLYNITTQVLNSPFSQLFIKNPKTNELYTINQHINLQKISNVDIYNHKFTSEMFDRFVSEDSLDAVGYLTYLKMLVSEGEDTLGVLERVCMTPKYKALSPNFFWTHFLSRGKIDNEYLIKSRLDEISINALLAILNGEYEIAESLLKKDRTKNQDITGCRLLWGLLENDKNLVGLQREKYTQSGYIGLLVSLLLSFKNDSYSRTKEELYTLNLIKQYPLVKAIFAIYGFDEYKLSKELYSLIKKLDYKVPILYYNQICDTNEKEKILKEALQNFPESDELKSLSYSKNYSWVRKYISCSSSLYLQELEKINKTRKHPYNSSFLQSINVDEDIEITNLGKGISISANCILISYKGYNVLLDVGLDPRKSEQIAYPGLDGIQKSIDFIIITHAHIDHCGGLPKAHSMWPNAKIIATAPTKTLMKYLFNDAAKIKNSKYSEFEITNITLEQEAIKDTLIHTIETDYERWIPICEKIKFRLHNAGHMIGAAMVELNINGKTIIYTGDFTDFNQSLSTGVDFSKLPNKVDLLISEATYVEKPEFVWNKCCEDFKNRIKMELKEGRTILIPAAAIGRTQELVCLLGEMSLNKELPKDTKLYLGGLAIPMTTQISPYFNERYDLILEQFNELGSFETPEDGSIIIASSNFMTKGSASYRVLSSMSLSNSITIFNNTKISKEAEDLINKAADVIVKSYSLPTHADKKGIEKLLDWTKPNFVSFIHCGGETIQLVQDTIQRFNNDICIYESKENKQIRVFDILQLMEEELV